MHIISVPNEKLPTPAARIFERFAMISFEAEIRTAHDDMIDKNQDCKTRISIVFRFLRTSPPYDSDSADASVTGHPIYTPAPEKNQIGRNDQAATEVGITRRKYPETQKQNHERGIKYDPVRKF
jgi:hypothetical protein